MVLEHLEILTYDEFCKLFNEQFLGLVDKYTRTGLKEYREKINKLTEIKNRIEMNREYTVPVKDLDETLGYLEFNSKRAKAHFEYDALSERQMNFR